MAKPSGNASGSGKFRHPAIVAGVKHIFFNSKTNMHLAFLPNSAGQRMKDQVPKSAVAWICVAVYFLPF
jgi:hypothetical protein